MTSAERQRAWRQRRTRRLAALEAENARLRAELDGLRGQLAAAQDEIGRLAGQACKHPAAAVDGGTCRACGNEVWR